MANEKLESKENINAVNIISASKKTGTKKTAYNSKRAF